MMTWLWHCKCPRRSAGVLDDQAFMHGNSAETLLEKIDDSVEMVMPSIPREVPGPDVCLKRPLLDACEGFDVMVALHLDARCLAQIRCASSRDCQRLSEPVVRWCADRRREELGQGLVRGDLALADTGEDVVASESGHWTLERLHLAEHPPRFPRLYFQFASDMLVRNSRSRIDEVVAILQQFPGLCIRIEGFGKPSAPPFLGRAVAQARAAATRQMILLRLARDPGQRARNRGENPWQHEDPSLGVFPNGGYDEGIPGSVEFYEPQLLGTRIQAVGQWGRDPQLRNLNFEAELSLDYDPEAKFQRVDFTVISFDGF
eukprot:TRINITY_DN110468_c0_g1_i1.p1 TRINITY_DN110468_c0_g1~~TRINITY_DN110468_c0_g1_i1.p1  ORF type:complete len:317 (-),score=44.30 TRINITY_DN110468_c0_g1_i1:35-985(-)